MLMEECRPEDSVKNRSKRIGFPTERCVEKSTEGAAGRPAQSRRREEVETLHGDIKRGTKNACHLEEDPLVLMEGCRPEDLVNTSRVHPLPHRALRGEFQ